MTQPRLRLLSTASHIENHTPLYVDVDSARLWNLVEDESVHLILKKPALLELARRRDSLLMDYCENLLSSGESEKWFLGVDILVAIGSPEATDRLILVYAQALNDERKHVLCMVAKVLTAEHVKPFSIMVRNVAVPGELDVTGWTKTAISTLKNACKRFGIETFGEGDKCVSERTGETFETGDFDEVSQFSDN
ncbi:MAG: hypothetical protein ACFFDV_09575 [Candidatus Thorarchaeota archaeon]